MILSHAEDDLHVCSLRMFEGIFSLDAAHVTTCDEVAKIFSYSHIVTH